MKKGNKFLSLFIYAIFFLAMIGLFSNITGLFTSNIEEVTYNQFISQLEKDEINTVIIQEKQGIYEIEGELSSSTEEEKVYYSTTAPKESYVFEQIENTAKEGVAITTESGSDYGLFSSLLRAFLFFGLPILLLVFLFSRMSKQNGKAMNFGKNKAQKVIKSKIKFKDVAGYEEEKQELVEIVEFLQNPTLFDEMGARIPKGILLLGPPGTGKTLLAKSVAGEAKVPFYTISGSDFVEMFVGVGASRVRELFKEAKKNAPAIVFIDEIDAVGRKRGNGIGGGNDEREQTLNQMLVEMDGFESNSGVIIMAATNRDDVLDPALLRPGRFDRQVRVDLPDFKTREKILTLHKNKRKMSDDINIKEYAKNTSGFSGADIENVINEAAIVAVRNRKKTIDDDDILEAIDRVVAGPAKKNRKYSELEKKLVSYHETGHVIVGLELDEADEVQKVTIVPRGQAGGYAMFTPKEERFFTTKTQILHKITGLLAGRASEEIYLKEISTGAHNDFERATKMARAMVTQYGMSDLGTYQYELNEDLQNPYRSARYSDDIAKEIDAKIKGILDQAYQDAKDILIKRVDEVHLIAKTLSEVETLNKNDIDYLLGNGELPKKLESEKYTAKEIEKIEKDAIKAKLKRVQKRQEIAKKKDKEVKVLTDKELDQMVESKYKATQKNKIDQPLAGDLKEEEKQEIKKETKQENKEDEL